MIVHAIKNIDVVAMVLYGFRIKSGMTACGRRGFITQQGKVVGAILYRAKDPGIKPVLQGSFRRCLSAESIRGFKIRHPELDSGSIGVAE